MKMSEIVAKQQANLLKVYRESMIEVSNRVIMRTPFRDGIAKSNWLASYGSPDTATTMQEQQGYVEQRVRDTATGLDVTVSYVFANSLPYIKRLEDGSSEQAEFGMLSLTLAEFDNIVNESISRQR